MFCTIPDPAEALNKIFGELQTVTTTPMDVVSSVLNNESTLLLCEDGWVVCYIAEEADRRIFWVWAAYARGAKAWEKYMPALEAIAVEHDCVEIGFNSAREGFKRTLKNTGYKPVSIEYRKNLDGQTKST